MAKTTTPTEDQEIEQEELEIKREYFVFVPILVLIVVLISMALPESSTRRAVDLVPTKANSGYWIVHESGVVTNKGTAANVEQGTASTNQDIVAGSTADPGLWTVSERGDIYALGNANYAGGIDSVYFEEEVVYMISTPNGRGYRIITKEGKVFDFNTSPLSGSKSLSDIVGQDHNEEVVAAVSTATGEGYWLLARDGKIYSFGDAAQFEDIELLNERVIAATSDGLGLLVLTNTGRVISVNGARHFGDLSSEEFSSNPVDIDYSPSGGGYWILLADGTVKAYGSAANL